jgi:hypothetical protein
MDLPEIATIERVRRRKRVPVVALAEVEAILAQLTGTHLLIIGLLHGTGIRWSECLRLWVTDPGANFYEKCQASQILRASTSSVLRLLA